LRNYLLSVMMMMTMMIMMMTGHLILQKLVQHMVDK